MRYLIIILLLLRSQFSYSQHRDAAIAIVDTLTSPYMNGRGYIADGVLHAASYIRNEFEKAGLKKFNNTFNQHFKINVNTFPDTVSLAINGTQFLPGRDFILDAHSASARGNYQLIYIDSTLVQSASRINKFLKQENRDAFLVVNKKEFGTKNFELLMAYMREAEGLHTAGLIELTDGKLSMNMAQQQFGYTHFIFRDTIFPAGAKSIETIVETSFERFYKTQNIIGYVEGMQADSFIVFSAHYDHLGQLGYGVYFPGANDNSSGVAMLIELARYYAQPEHKPAYSILFIAFAGEEVGLLGSQHFTENPLVDLRKILFVVNMDILGTGDDGIKVVNGAVHSAEFDRLVAINDENQYLKSVQPRGKAANSDHYFFTEKGVPAFFIYTLGGIDAYHDIYDKPETLPLTEFEDIFRLLTDFVKGF